MTSPSHPSDSRVQRDAEAKVIEATSIRLGVDLRRTPDVTRIAVATSARVEVDAADLDQTTFVEAYARQGALKGAQLKKVAQDVLKLALLDSETAHTGSRRVIVFASEEAKDSVRGWLLAAAEKFGVELMVVEISDELRHAIRAAQSRQIMVNADEVAGDVYPEHE